MHNLRRLRPFFLLLLLAVAGCLQVDQHLTLNADGSGSFVLRYGMAQATIDQMAAVSKEAMMLEGLTNEVDDASPFDFDEEEIRRDFKSYEAHGVTLRSVKIDNQAGWKYVNLDIAFTNLEGLARTEFIADHALSLRRQPDGSYVLRQAAPAEKLAPEDLAGLDEASIRAMMAEMMKGFRAAMKISVPGKITATTAPTNDGHTASWVYDLDRDPQALERAQKTEIQVAFEGKDLALPEFTPAPAPGS